MDVFRVERRDESLVEAREDLVNQFIAAPFQQSDFRGIAGESRAPGAQTVQQQPGCFGDHFHLFEEQAVELLLTWQ